MLLAHYINIYVSNEINSANNTYVVFKKYTLYLSKWKPRIQLLSTPALTLVRTGLKGWFCFLLILSYLIILSSFCIIFLDSLYAVCYRLGGLKTTWLLSYSFYVSGVHVESLCSVSKWNDLIWGLRSSFEQIGSWQNCFLWLCDWGSLKLEATHGSLTHDLRNMAFCFPKISKTVS